MGHTQSSLLAHKASGRTEFALGETSEEMGSKGIKSEQQDSGMSKTPGHEASLWGRKRERETFRTLISRQGG